MSRVVNHAGERKLPRVVCFTKALPTENRFP